HPSFSLPPTWLFPVPIPAFPCPYPGFPCPYPGFSLSLSRLFPVHIPAFPAAKPRLDNEGCPRQQNWTEGQKENLTCQAEGRPKPEVKCFKDGHFFKAGIAYDVNLTSAGTYLCQATNAVGTAERNVTIWVQ
ncbi:ICAM1 protein, partial [Orthonyx spaldingii]|nr:ICAM1 protein [Orthonyx spaldingii]